MSGRLSVLLATRQDLAAEAVLGGARKLPGQNSVLGKIHKLETDFEGMKVTTSTLSKGQDRIDTSQVHADASMKWLTNLGIGSAALGIGGAMFKFYHYDLNQTNQIKAHIRDVVGSLEKVTMSKFESLESKIENLDSRLDRMESRMERMESKIDQKIGNLESKMDQKIGNLESKMEKMESKMDHRMDEIVSYLQGYKSGRGGFSM
ncbi:hypothetical protein HOY82DRAFT_534951 [Tuber indicum]|nr:hypothetical protein HOY82DRAFT_534951 [Tuber indicum]